MLIFGNTYVHMTVALQTQDWCDRLLCAVNLMLANIIDQHWSVNRHHSYVCTFNWLSVELKPVMSRNSIRFLQIVAPC